MHPFDVTEFFCGLHIFLVILWYSSKRNPNCIEILKLLMFKNVLTWLKVEELKTTRLSTEGGILLLHEVVNHTIFFSSLSKLNLTQTLLSQLSQQGSVYSVVVLGTRIFLTHSSFSWTWGCWRPPECIYISIRYIDP